MSILLLIWGKISDIYGKKKIFASGFIIFTLSSALFGLSQNLGFLIFARILQAVGASSMMALSQVIITSSFPANERGKVLGIIGTTVAIAILAIIGSFVGVFFIPALGRWLDRFGIKKLLYADALSFIGVYLLYGLLSKVYSNGTLAKVGIPVFLAYGLFIIDRMSAQMGLVRTIYLRSIAIMDSDITPTLSLGMSMDHIVSIISAYLGGIVWSLWGATIYLFPGSIFVIGKSICSFQS